MPLAAARYYFEARSASHAPFRCCHTLLSPHCYAAFDILFCPYFAADISIFFAPFCRRHATLRRLMLIATMARHVVTAFTGHAFMPDFRCYFFDYAAA